MKIPARPPRPSAPELDRVLRTYAESVPPPSPERRLTEALLAELTARREAAHELDEYRSDTGHHYILDEETAHKWFVARKVEEDAATMRRLRRGARAMFRRVLAHALSALAGGGAAWLIHRFAP